MPIETGSGIPLEHADFHVPEEESGMEAQKNPEVVRSLNALRKKVVKALMVGGLLAALEACGGLRDREEEIEQMPKVGVGELSQDPHKFLDGPMLRTEGYPTFEQRETTHGLGMSMSGNVKITENVKDFYRLSETEGGTEGPSIELTMNSSDETQHLPKHKFRVLGYMVRWDEGKYKFFVTDTLDLDQPVEKPDPSQIKK